MWTARQASGENSLDPGTPEQTARASLPDEYIFPARNSEVWDHLKKMVSDLEMRSETLKDGTIESHLCPTAGTDPSRCRHGT